MKTLFDGELISKVKDQAGKVKTWVVENPELALVGGALGSYGILLLDALFTNKHARNCERKRTKAYVDRLNRD